MQAAKIVRELQTFVRPRPREVTLVDLRDVIARILVLREDALRVSGIALVREIAASVPLVRGDASQLEQVLLNLVLNAEQALAGCPDGRIAVRLHAHEGRVRVAVADTGPGIPADVLPRIFEPFFSTKPVGQGTGLGLSICYSIVQSHGGRLTADSRPGLGATFVVDLPAHDGATVARPAAAAPAAQRIGRGHVLVVDDEEDVAGMLGDLLKELGVSATVVSDAESAWRALTREDRVFDAVTLDLRMPGTSGRSLYERLEERVPAAAARVIFLTGDTADAETERFLRHAGRPVLTKPLALEPLALALTPLLLSAGAPPAAPDARWWMRSSSSMPAHRASSSRSFTSARGRRSRPGPTDRLTASARARTSPCALPGARRSSTATCPASGARITGARWTRSARGWGSTAATIAWWPRGTGSCTAGSQYAAPVLIDAEVMAGLERLVPLAPLHQPHNLAAIRAIAASSPDLPQVACFDTAFHQTQPPVAQVVALPRELAAEGVRRYGFHGLSYEYIASALPAVAPRVAAGRVVVAHLGNGASLCAMNGGRSVATTMGFSTLDGLVMGTRPGSLDPGVLLYLMSQHKMDAAAIEALLYTRSGLLGLSGISSDMRTLLASPDPRAREAVDVFVYRIGRELGSLAAALGGLDALVFTAGIGEHAPEIRARVCRDAGWLGIGLDEAANGAGGPLISQPGARASAWVIPTDENLMIARHTLAVLAASRPSRA